jgi:hypothetical protein
VIYKSYVYFHGPQTAWLEKPAPSEILATFESRWRFLAHSRAIAAVRLLNAGRCGVVVNDAQGNLLEHVPASVVEA